MKFIRTATDTTNPSQLGGKAAALASLATTGLRIPAWFVVAPEAFHHSFALNEAVQHEVAQALRRLCPNNELVAVRSSAVDEDGRAHSFAGQLDSFLFVAPHEVAEKIVAVWRSGFSERLLAYRREKGLVHLPAPPAVLVQRMVNADVAGVAFAADPISGRRDLAVVSATRGVGAALVAGACDADTYHINRAGEIVQRTLLAETPILRDEQIQAIATLACATSQHFQRPQDIEWAIEKGELFLLQSRPITTLANVADPAGTLNLWDNSNIAESYGGVTTPLTFSFARRAYEEVYRQFCRVLCVPAAAIQANDQTFKHMLGLLGGRVYYNLLNWYRVLALLPGFKLNRRFMEQMMGVKEGLPEYLVQELSASTRGEKLRDVLNLLATMRGLISNHWRLPNTIARFYARLNDALQEPVPTLSEMRADELAAYYRKLEAQLLTRWDAPLINDFFAMIFYGVLRRLCERHDANLHNSLLCNEGGIISTEPTRQLRAMAASIVDQPALIEALCHDSLPAINQQLAHFSSLQSQISNYLSRFGDRCLDELKLESPTLHDDPLLLLRSLGQLAARLEVGEEKATATNLRAAAEAQMNAALAGHPMRRVLFRWVLRHARARVRERENLRFERTRLFGRARRLFVEIGRRFAADDLLAEPRDVFYLEVEEILGFIHGTATTTNLKALVAVRQAEYAVHRQAPAPADRFATRGTVHQGQQLQAQPRAVVTAIGDVRQGLACCSGRVRGKVRVITDPRNAQLQPGEILVAERTDPGWILLFSSATALLVERGSLLSHAAIVAREMSLPAIVSIPGVTQWLQDGDEVELDGSTGVLFGAVAPLWQSLDRCGGGFLPHHFGPRFAVPSGVRDDGVA